MITRWEILGAWLHIWTPPRGVVVPPVPARKIVIGTLALALVAAVAAALVVPQVNDSKARGAAERARQAAVADAAEAARLRRDQRPHVAQVPAGQPLVTTLESAISADARKRVALHTMSGQILRTDCSASPAYVSVYPHSRVYKCFVLTTTGHQGVLPGDEFGTGYSFVATIYFPQRRLVWCKENPHPDEKGARGANHVVTSPRCAGKLREVL